MRKLICLAILIAFELLQPLSAVAQPQQSFQEAPAERVTRANWQQHPKIEAVREIVKAVIADWESGVLKTSHRNFENCDGSFTEFRRLSVDANGMVRRYEFAYSAEDDSRTDEYYYDESGRLRFVLISGWNASDGVAARHRIYFDENGKRLWEDSKGKGLYWPQKWPDKDLHKSDAAKDFANTTKCEREVKPVPKR